MSEIKPTPLLDLEASNPFLSQKERNAIEARKKVMDQMFEQAGLAKYKIEILLGKGYAPSKPSVGIMSFWESGSKFHGGGDTILHMCCGKDKGINDCNAFIPDSGHGYGFLVCSRCHQSWNGEDVIGQLAFRLTAQNWARAVLKYYQKLDMNADIVVKYHPDDIRNAAMAEQLKTQGGEVLAGARSRRVPRVYPLKNIIKDTSAGADLEGRFYAFMRA